MGMKLLTHGLWCWGPSCGDSLAVQAAEIFRRAQSNLWKSQLGPDSDVGRETVFDPNLDPVHVIELCDGPACAVRMKDSTH